MLVPGGMLRRIFVSTKKTPVFGGPLRKNEAILLSWFPSVARRATTTSPSTWAPWCLPRPVVPSTKKLDGNGRDQSTSSIRNNHLNQTTQLSLSYIPFYKKQQYPNSTLKTRNICSRVQTSQLLILGDKLILPLIRNPYLLGPRLCHGLQGGQTTLFLRSRCFFSTQPSWYMLINVYIYIHIYYVYHIYIYRYKQIYSS